MFRVLRRILLIVATVALTAYIGVAVVYADRLDSQEVCEGIFIRINDDSPNRFVTVHEISREIAPFPNLAVNAPLKNIDIDSIERMLLRLDKIETVDVTRLSDRRILVDVTPLQPVARIFDRDSSYYINRQGKRMMANARYHRDVPVLCGDFSRSPYTPLELLPLLDRLSTDSVWAPLMAMLEVNERGDIIYVPAIRGHVINLGTPDQIDDKLQRMGTFYSKVLPTVGWELYDTISVKWKGQVVASRRLARLEAPKFVSDEEEADPDISTMMAAEGVAPGQALPGVAPVDEKLIPAAQAERASAPDSIKTQ